MRAIAARWLPLFAAFALLLGCDPDEHGMALSGPSGPAAVELRPDKASYGIGERIVVKVEIDGADNVGSVPFHLRFDPRVLDFAPPATEGPFLGSDGELTVFFVSESPGGQIIVGLSRLDADEGMSGAGTLAVFEFDAIATGDCGFAFTSASVKDPDAVTLPAAFDAASVRVD